MDFLLKDAESGKEIIKFDTPDENPMGTEFEFGMPVFKWVEKADPKTKKKHLYIAGFASTSGLDRQSDNISEQALRASAKDLMKSGARTVFFNHEHRQLPVGLVVDSKYDEFINEDGELIKGIYTVVKISNANGVEDIRTQIKEGILNSFSIGGKFNEVEEIKDEDNEFMHFEVLSMELFEVSVVGIPAQTRAAILESVTKSFDLDASITGAKVVKSKKIEEDDTLLSSKSQDKAKEAGYENAWNSLTGEKTMAKKEDQTPAEKKVEDKKDEEVVEEPSKQEEENKDEEAVDAKSEEPEFLTVDKATEIIGTKVSEAVDPIKKQVSDFANTLSEIAESLKSNKEGEAEDEPAKEEPKDETPDAMKALMDKIDNLEKKFDGAVEEGKALGAARGQIEDALNKDVDENASDADVEAKVLKEQGIDVTKDFDREEVVTYYLERYENKYDDLSDEQKEKVKLAYLMLAQKKSAQAQPIAE